MRRLAAALAILVAAGIVTAGIRGLLWWPVSGSSIAVQLTDIASIELRPVPEGPDSLFWINPPTSPSSEGRREVEAAIPLPLPGPEVQPVWCRGGGNMFVKLTNGTVITYGPCRHPDAIRALWATIVRVDSGGRCIEPCAPTE